MPDDEITLDEIYAEVDKRVAAAIEKLTKEKIEPIEKRLPAEKKPFRVIRKAV